MAAWTLHVSIAPPARAEDQAIVTRNIPVTEGIAVEGSTTVPAAAEQIARIAASPQHMLELLPAEGVKVLGQEGDAQRVEVTMHEPWPIGRVHWVERITRRVADDGRTLVVERAGEQSKYHRRLRSTWSITPHHNGHSQVTYRVWMEPQSWVPKWMMRRGIERGIPLTLRRLCAVLARN